MNNGWQTVKLEDACEVIAGQSPEGKYYNKEGKGLPFYQGKKEFTEKFIGQPTTWTTNVTKEARRGDILMSVRAPVGPINFATQQMCIGRGLAAIRAGTLVDEDFLFYFLLSKQDKIKGQAGAVFSSINKKQIGNIKLDLPPLEEQEQIVAILDDAFEGIEKVQANAEKNLANAHELFENTLNFLLSKEDSKCHAYSLKDVVVDTCSLSYGIVQPGKTVPNGLPIVRPTDLKEKFITLTQLKRIKSSIAEQYRRTTLSGGELLLCVRGTTGTVSIATNELKGANVTRGIVPIVFNASIIDQAFGYYLFLSKRVQDQIKAATYGAALMQINIRDVKKISLVVPSIETQRTIVKKLSELLGKIERLQQIYQNKMGILANLKQSLLKKAFSGKLTYSNVVSITRPISQQHVVATTSPEFGAHVIAYGYHWHEGQRKNKTYGHVKTQKILHLAESVAGLDMGRFPEKCAAGPHDAQHMRQAEEWAKQNQFFEFVQRSDGKGYDFKKLENYNKLIGNSIAAVKPYQNRLQKILSLLLPMNTRQAEVLATVHAAWNNLLLDNVKITDDAIIHEARENWTESKRSIPESEFRKAITTIRSNGIVPDGTAKRVAGQESLPL